MEGTPIKPKKKKISTFKLILLLILGFILLTFALEAVGIDVMGTKAKEEIIHRPHAE